jgi:hypothetical protein
MRGREVRARRRSFRVKTLGFGLGNALLFVTAAAATLPPVVNESISESEKSWRATTKPSEGLTMGRLKIQFEKTTLPEVLSAIKLGSIQHQGDAGDSVSWLCYTALTHGYNARIWIESSDEMGGPGEAVTDVAIQKITDGRSPADCPILPKQYEPLSFNNGVWLGTPNGTVKNVFPSGLLRSGQLAFIGYQGKVADDGHCDGGYDLLNSLYLTFKAGLVIAMDAGQVTSC